MSSIYHSGYGYSKRTCENVTSWYLNKNYPRHKIDVDIVHRGLKRDGVVGYCDVIGRSYRPRHFLIELQSDMCKDCLFSLPSADQICPEENLRQQKKSGS